MRWPKRDKRKVGFAIAGVLLLLVLMIWFPASAAGAQERASELATPVTGTVQATPTEDATVTALNKEKLVQEVQQLKNQNYWSWTTIGPILVGFAGLLAALYSFITWIRNRQDEQKKRDEEQKRWLDDRQAEREKRAEERFQAVVEGLGSEREEAKAGAAIMLRTFLEPGYEQFYRQAFDLAVTHLRLRKVDPNIAQVVPNIPYEPPDSLTQALITVLKESFPLAREKLRKQLEAKMLEFDPALLDATGSHLENAYLSRTDLKQVYLRHAFLQKAHFWLSHLEGANLKHSNLTSAFLEGAHLEGADLGDTKLMGAEMKGAYLQKTHLTDADLTGADLTGTHPEDAKSLTRTILHNVKGLTKDQLAICKAKGAIVDEDSAASSTQSTVFSSSQSTEAQVPSAPPAQESTSAPATDGSKAGPSQHVPEL